MTVFLSGFNQVTVSDVVAADPVALPAITLRLTALDDVVVVTATRIEEPGKPVENAFIESFNGRLRDECLNVNQFVSLADAKAKIEAWRVDDNQCRPHSSLGHLTPKEFAKQRQEDRIVEGAPLQLQPVS